MTRITATALAVVALWAISGPVDAFGKTEDKFYSGECNGGNVPSWWCVITYVNGVATKMTGMNCRGQMYYNIPIGSMVVSSNPILGLASTATGVDDDNRVWYAVTVYDSDNHPIWMGGVTGDGTCWIADTLDPILE